MFTHPLVQHCNSILLIELGFAEVKLYNIPTLSHFQGVYITGYNMHRKFLSALQLTLATSVII